MSVGLEQQVESNSRVFLVPGEFENNLNLLRDSKIFSNLSALIVDSTSKSTFDVFKYLQKSALHLGPVSVGTLLHAAGFKDVKVVYEVLTPNFDYSSLNPDIIGVSAIATNVPYANERLKYFRREHPDALLIAGGAGYTFNPEVAIQNGADIVVLGKAEYPLPELVKRLVEQCNGESLKEADNRVDISDIPGLYTKKMVSTGFAPMVKNLDEIPSPDFDLIPGKKSRFMRTLISSEGCIHNCDFCSTVTLNRRAYRVKSPEQVVEELSLVRNQGIKRVFFVDDHAFARGYMKGRYKNLADFLNAIKKADLGIGWTAQATVASVDRFIDDGIVELLEDGNCHSLCLGIEAIDDDSMRQINGAGKNSYEQTERVLNVLKDSIVAVHAMLVLKPFVPKSKMNIVPYSAEDSPEGIAAYRKEIQDSVDFLQSYNVRTAQFHCCIPAPGTKSAEMAFQAGIVLKRVGGQPVDWSKYTGQYAVASSNPHASMSIMEDAYRRFYSLGYILEPLTKPFSPSFSNTLRKALYRIVGRVTTNMFFNGDEARQYNESLKQGDFEFYKPGEKFIF